MPARITASGTKQFWSTVQRLLKLRARHAALHGNRLILLIEGDDFLEPLSHIKGHPSLHRLHASGNAAPAAIDVEGDLVGGAIGHELFHLLRRARIYDHIRQAVHPPSAKPQGVVPCLAVSYGQPGIVLRRHIFFPDNIPQRLQMDFCESAGCAQFYAVHPDIPVVLSEVVICHVELFLHHLVKRFLRILYKIRISPPEDRAVAVFRCGLLHPFWFKSFVWPAHMHPLLYSCSESILLVTMMSAPSPSTSSIRTVPFSTLSDTTILLISSITSNIRSLGISLDTRTGMTGTFGNAVATVEHTILIGLVSSATANSSPLLHRFPVTRYLPFDSST